MFEIWPESVGIKHKKMGVGIWIKRPTATKPASYGTIWLQREVCAARSEVSATSTMMKKVDIMSTNDISSWFIPSSPSKIGMSHPLSL